MNEAILKTESEANTYRRILDNVISIMLSVIAVTLIIAGVACFMEASILSGIFYITVGVLISMLVYASRTGKLMSYLEM